MGELNSAFIKSIKTIFNINILKLIMPIGFISLLMWVLLGWLLWDYVLSLTSSLIKWLPFSILAFDGTILILSFLWLVGVLATFAILTIFIAPVLFKGRMGKVLNLYTFILITLISAIIAYLLLANWHKISAQVDTFLLKLPYQTVSEWVSALLTFYLFYNLFILTLYFIVSFFRKKFLDTVRSIEYSDIEVKSDLEKKRHYIGTVKDSITFLTLFIVLFPTLFIPIVNIFIQLFLWAWLYRESYFLSTCSLYCLEDEFNELHTHRFTIWTIAIFSSLLNFIPLINIFAPFFAQLMFFYWIMNKKA